MTGLVHRAVPRVSLAELLHKVRGPSERDLAAALEAAAAKLEPKLRDAFLAAVEALGTALDLDRLVALLEAGRVGDAVVLMDRALSSPNAWDPFKAAVVQSVQVAADTAARLQPAIPFGPDGLGALEIRFNTLNPRTAEYLRRYAADLATELSDGARRAVNQAARVIIREGVIAGQGARDTASQLKAAIGLNAQQEAAARNYEAALRAGDMARARDYKLRDKRFNHDKAPDGPDKIDRMVEGYRKKALAYRALVISRTESIRALHVGQHQLWEQQVQEGRVRLEDVHRKWIYSADSKVRHAHKTIPRRNKEGRGLREAFDTELGPLMFPGDPAGKAANVIQCRCTVITRLHPRAFAAAEVQPPKPAPVPAKPVRAPKPPPDPLGLARKSPTEVAWHAMPETWSKAPKVLRDAIQRATPVYVFHSDKHVYCGTNTGGTIAQDAGENAYGYINMGPPELYAPGGKQAAQGVRYFRHEYGHHLDYNQTRDGRGDRFVASMLAAPDVAKEGPAMLKALGKESGERTTAEFRRLTARAEAEGLRAFREYDGPDSIIQAQDLAENAAMVEDATAALPTLKLGPKVTLADFMMPPPETGDETPMERSYREAGAARQVLQMVAAINTKAPRALAQAAGRDPELMDFLGAMTKEDSSHGKFGYGHKPEYYTQGGPSQDGVTWWQTVEAFAEWVEALGQNKVASLAVMKALAPKTVRRFEGILASLAKGEVPK